MLCPCFWHSSPSSHGAGWMTQKKPAVALQCYVLFLCLRFTLWIVKQWSCCRWNSVFFSHIFVKKVYIDYTKCSPCCLILQIEFVLTVLKETQIFWCFAMQMTFGAFFSSGVFDIFHWRVSINPSCLCNIKPEITFCAPGTSEVMQNIFLLFSVSKRTIVSIIIKLLAVILSINNFVVSKLTHAQLNHISHLESLACSVMSVSY